MNEIRKYITIIENNERLDEISRSDAINTIESFSYNIALHLMKCHYYSDIDSYNHWITEIKNFVNSIIKRTRKVRIKRPHIYQHLSQDVLTIQTRRSIIEELHRNYGYEMIDYDDINDIMTG